MNRERAKELLPIIQAYADGKVIQYRRFGNEWATCKEDSFGMGFNQKTEYRIKPEPREFWIHEGSMHAYSVANLDPTIKMIHVREVLE